MKKIIFTLLFITIGISHISAQALEKIVKKNQPIICNCINGIETIESEEDLEIKFQNCMKVSEKDSLQLQKNGTLDFYQEKIQEALEVNCPNIERKIYSLLEDYKTYISNYRYDLEPPYKEIEKKVIGAYSLGFGHHSPEGNPKLFIYPENRYAIVSFGEVQAGSWRVVKEKYLHLIPNKAEYPFTVYGRYNPKIKDSTKTSFLGDDFSYHTLINYGEPDKKPLLTPIFNIDANCFDFPYKKTMSKVHNKISLAYNNSYLENDEIYLHTFDNTKRFNDFVVFEHTRKNDRSNTVIITIGDNALIFGEDQVTPKSSLNDLSEDDHAFIKKIIAVRETSSFVYYNPGYQNFDHNEITSEVYTFDEKLNTYVSKYDCTGSDCEEDNYHNYSRINKYELLGDITTTKKKYDIAEKSVIYTVCD